MTQISSWNLWIDLNLITSRNWIRINNIPLLLGLPKAPENNLISYNSKTGRVTNPKIFPSYNEYILINKCKNKIKLINLNNLNSGIDLE